MHQTQTPETLQHQLRQQTKRKYLTNLYIFSLIDLHSISEKSYWKTYYCCNSLTQENHLNSDGEVINSRVLTRHCKLKHCIICSQLRTSDLVYSYKPTLDSWIDSQFLTLTVPNCNAKDLRNTLETMHKGLRNITRTINQRRKRNKSGDKLQYVCHFETTYNAKSNTYHPHLHMVCFDEIDGGEILTEWLRTFPSASRKAQDLKSADQKSVMELFKYFTKIISTKDSSRTIYVEALDIIFQASRGKRTFVASGVKKIKKTNADYETFLETIESETAQTIISTFDFEKDYGVYVNPDTGETLCDYFPSETLSFLKVAKHNPQTAYNISIAPLETSRQSRKGKRSLIPSTDRKTF